MTPLCASHRWVELCGVRPTTELSSSVCITPRSQVIKISQKAPQRTSHRRVKLRHVPPTDESNCTQWSQNAHSGVKIEIFVSLWLLLKGQSGVILLGVITSIMKEKIRRKLEYLIETEFENT